MSTGVSNYQRSTVSRAMPGAAAGRAPVTGADGVADSGSGTPAPGTGGAAGAGVAGPQVGAREGWEVPERPATVMSARDLRAMQKQQSGATGRRRKVSPLLIAGVAVFCLAAAGTAVLYTRSLHTQAGGNAGGAAVPKQAARPGPVYSFEPFIVNVAGTGGTRYLKATISVECADRKASSEISEAEIRVRDAVLDVLSTYSLEDLTDVSKRDAIRRRVADAIEGAVPGRGKGPARVKGVYFLEFVIQ